MLRYQDPRDNPIGFRVADEPFSNAAFCSSRASFSGRAIGRELYPDLGALLTALEIPPVDHETLLPYLQRNDPQEACSLILWAVNNKVLPERIVERIRAHLPTDNTVKALEDSRQELVIDQKDGERILYSTRDKELRIKLFPCICKEVDCSDAPSALGKLERRAYGLFLPPEDYRRLEPSIVGKKHDHVNSALGYIYFYDSIERTYISEIQSDVYGRLSERSLRERYKHWAEILLLAFEHCFNESRRRLNEGILKVSVPFRLAVMDSDWAKRRWPTMITGDRTAGSRERPHLEGAEILEGIAPALAEHLYEKVPAKLGFHKLPVEEPFALERSPLDEDVAIRNWWTRIPGMEDQHPFRNQFAEVLQSGNSEVCGIELLNNLFVEWYYGDFERHGLPRSWRAGFSFRIGGRDLRSAIEPPLYPVPQRQIKFDTIEGLTPAMIEEWRRALTLEWVRPIVAGLPNDFTWVTRGDHAGICSGLWDSFERAGSDSSPNDRVVYVVDREFSPALRIAAPVDSGSGKVSLVLDGACDGGRFYWDDPHDNPRLFPFQHDDCSGIAWLELSAATKSFVNTLSLRWLFSRVSSHEEPPLPVPLDIGIFESVPTWRSGQVTWQSVASFMNSYAGSIGSDSLGCTYRYMERCDVRWSEFIRSILPGWEHNFKVDPLASLMTGLSLLYESFGKDFSAPPAPIYPDAARRLRDLGPLLSLIAAHNGNAGQEIYHQIERKLTLLVGAIHGAGGHLGGNLPLKEISLPVTFHPTRHLYLPWMMTERARLNDDDLLKPEAEAIWLLRDLNLLHTVLCGRELDLDSSLASLLHEIPDNEGSRFRDVFDKNYSITHPIVVAALPEHYRLGVQAGKELMAEIAKELESEWS